MGNAYHLKNSSLLKSYKINLIIVQLFYQNFQAAIELLVEF